MNDVMLGAIAGFGATVPMTAAMEALHRELPHEESGPLPPRTVTMRVAQEAGIQKELDEDERVSLTLAAHFGMGTVMGALYGPVSRLIPLPAPVAGAGFGLVVWAANYLGVLPALGLLSPATQHPPRRAGLMIAAHLVWGAGAGLKLSLLANDERTDSESE